MLNNRMQILLDDDRHGRLRRRAAETGESVGALIREAIDRAYPELPPERARAGRRLLDAAPMPVEDWPGMKRAMLDEIHDPGPPRDSG